MSKLCKNCGMMTVPSLHVCNPVAVRDPKPAPTVKPRLKVAKKKHTGRVVARRMWTCGENVTAPKSRARYYAGFKKVDPVFVLPADAASVERMVEQVAEALASTHGEQWRTQARAALAAIGIKAKGGSRG